MNPNLAIVQRHWPTLVAQGLITVAQPATNHDHRSYRPEYVKRDLERRRLAYLKKKEASRV